MLDFFEVNKGFQADAAKILALSYKADTVELVSASAVTDIYYMVRKATHDKEETLSKLKLFRKYVHVLPVTERDIDTALSRGWKDFEDAVQYTVAESCSVDIIITRNKKDFEEDGIPCYEPAEFLNLVEYE